MAKRGFSDDALKKYFKDLPPEEREWIIKKWHPRVDEVASERVGADVDAGEKLSNAEKDERYTEYVREYLTEPKIIKGEQDIMEDYGIRRKSSNKAIRLIRKRDRLM